MNTVTENNELDLDHIYFKDGNRYIVSVPIIFKEQYGTSVYFTEYEKAIALRNQFLPYYQKRKHKATVTQIEGHYINWDLVNTIQNKNTPYEIVDLNPDNLVYYKKCLIKYGLVDYYNGVFRLMLSIPNGHRTIKLYSIEQIKHIINTLNEANYNRKIVDKLRELNKPQPCDEYKEDPDRIRWSGSSYIVTIPKALTEKYGYSKTFKHYSDAKAFRDSIEPFFKGHKYVKSRRYSIRSSPKSKKASVIYFGGLDEDSIDFDFDVENRTVGPYRGIGINHSIDIGINTSDGIDVSKDNNKTIDLIPSNESDYVMDITNTVNTTSDINVKETTYENTPENMKENIQEDMQEGMQEDMKENTQNSAYEQTYENWRMSLSMCPPELNVFDVASVIPEGCLALDQDRTWHWFYYGDLFVEKRKNKKVWYSKTSDRKLPYCIRLSGIDTKWGWKTAVECKGPKLGGDKLDMLRAVLQFVDSKEFDRFSQFMYEKEGIKIDRIYTPSIGYGITHNDEQRAVENTDDVNENIEDIDDIDDNNSIEEENIENVDEVEAINDTDNTDNIDDIESTDSSVEDIDIDTDSTEDIDIDDIDEDDDFDLDGVDDEDIDEVEDTDEVEYTEDTDIENTVDSTDITNSVDIPNDGIDITTDIDTPNDITADIDVEENKKENKKEDNMLTYNTYILNKDTGTFLSIEKASKMDILKKIVELNTTNVMVLIEVNGKWQELEILE